MGRTLNAITATFPAPVSANVYWRTRVVKGVAMTYVSKEAQQFKAAVASVLLAAGVSKPMAGRVAVEVWMYPHRPQDWAKRQRKLGAGWDDSVRAIDLDNAIKVTLDAMKGLAFEDDVWVRRIAAQRMEPDERGARVVVRVSQIETQQPQGDLLEAS